MIVVSLEAGSGLWELGRGAGGRLACGRVARGLVTLEDRLVKTIYLE